MMLCFPGSDARTLFGCARAVGGGGEGWGGGGGGGEQQAKMRCEGSYMDHVAIFSPRPWQEEDGFEGPAFARRANALPSGHIPGLAS